MNTELITIAIPAYKSQYLAQSISSALAQTYQNIEVLVVDDKSPEDLESIVDLFPDTRLKYYRNEENLGGKDFVSSWNRCLELANGRFFCLLCDDDIYAPNFVEEMVTLWEKYPDTKVFRARANMIDGNNNIVDYYPSCPEFETVTDYMFHREKDLRQQTVSEFMIETEHMRSLGGYVSLPLGWGSDVASCYLFGKDNGIVSSQKVLASFRQSGINMSTAGKRTIEKIDALNQYSIFVHNMLKDLQGDSKYLELIGRWNDITTNRLKFEYLRKASIKDLYYIARNLQSDGVKISAKAFFVAMFYRCGYALTSFLR